MTAIVGLKKSPQLDALQFLQQVKLRLVVEEILSLTLHQVQLLLLV